MVMLSVLLSIITVVYICHLYDHRVQEQLLENCLHTSWHGQVCIYMSTVYSCKKKVQYLVILNLFLLARLSGHEEEDPDYEELEAVLHSQRKVCTHILMMMTVLREKFPSLSPGPTDQG